MYNTRGIAATPTLLLRDREFGKTLLLHDPVGGDALLWAIDLLTAGSTTVANPAIPQTCSPALPVTGPGSHRSSRLRRGLSALIETRSHRIL